MADPHSSAGVWRHTSRGFAYEVGAVLLRGLAGGRGSREAWRDATTRQGRLGRARPEGPNLASQGSAALPSAEYAGPGEVKLAGPSDNMETPAVSNPAALVTSAGPSGAGDGARFGGEVPLEAKSELQATSASTSTAAGTRVERERAPRSIAQAIKVASVWPPCPATVMIAIVHRVPLGERKLHEGWDVCVCVWFHRACVARMLCGAASTCAHEIHVREYAPMPAVVVSQQLLHRRPPVSAAQNRGPAVGAQSSVALSLVPNLAPLTFHFLPVWSHQAHNHDSQRCVHSARSGQNSTC